MTDLADLADVGARTGGAAATRGTASTASELRAARLVRRRRPRAAGWTSRPDRNGNLWAWWGDRRRPDAVVTGSHLDSVPAAARSTGRSASSAPSPASTCCAPSGFTPQRPLGDRRFAEEEGGRFGVACLGSRLMTGAITRTAARALTDARRRHASARPCRRRVSTRAGSAATSATLAPHRRLRRAAHRAGRAAAWTSPVGVASAIWPHGRWRFDLHRRGQPRRHDAHRRPARPDADRRARRCWPPARGAPGAAARATVGPGACRTPAAPT